MTNLLAVIAATFLALTALLGSGAEAGFNVRLKLPADFSVLHKTCDAAYGDDENDEDENYGTSRNRSKQSVSRRHPKPTLEAQSRQVDRPVATANAESNPAHSERANEAERENSSIATAHDKIAAAKDAGCKNYFASAGLTLSVSCEK
jgi:hypothetical protein